MPSESQTDHVCKRCDCSKWKECTHPWYVDYQEGKTRLRGKLVALVGREPTDFGDAKTEARRAIVAWTDGKDARDLLPMDAPTLSAVLDDYGKRPNGAPIDRYQRGPIVTSGCSSSCWRRCTN